MLLCMWCTTSRTPRSLLSPAFSAAVCWIAALCAGYLSEQGKC